MGVLEEKLWVTGEHWVPFSAFLQLDVSSSGTSTFIIMADLCDNDLSCKHIKTVDKQNRKSNVSTFTA